MKMMQSHLSVLITKWFWTLKLFWKRATRVDDERVFLLQSLKSGVSEGLLLLIIILKEKGISSKITASRAERTSSQSIRRMYFTHENVENKRRWTWKLLFFDHIPSGDTSSWSVYLLMMIVMTMKEVLKERDTIDFLGIDSLLKMMMSIQSLVRSVRTVIAPMV